MPSLVQRLFGTGFDGRSGRPRSSNGASSAHLRLEVPEGEWVAVEATLEVLEAPSTHDLVFWALQASFTDAGRRFGAGHLGLQWHAPHPGSTAVNWGGYGPDGRVLEGTDSPLPSATGNPHTRDLAWEPGVPYRLRIVRAEVAGGPPGAWRGSVTGPDGREVVVRDLLAGGSYVADLVVWTECFAPCDVDAGAVAWSDLEVVAADGQSARVGAAVTSYQSVRDGGCVTSDTRVDDGRFVQRTGVERTTAPGTRLVLGT